MIIHEIAHLTIYHAQNLDNIIARRNGNPKGLIEAWKLGSEVADNRFILYRFSENYPPK